MADIPMKSIQWPGLPDTYTFLQKASSLTAQDASGKAADAAQVNTALGQLQAGYEADDEVLGQRIDQLEAEIDTDSGEAPTLVAGTAEQLLSTTGTANPTPYTYRENASGSDRVTISQITGGAVVWNQLVSFSAGTSTSKGITATANADGTVSFSGTATEDYAFYAISPRRENIQSHVIMLQGCPSGGSTTGYRLQDGYSSSSSRDTGSGKLYKITSASGYSNAQVSISSGTTVENVVFKPQYIDLTLMFGSTVADYIYGLETATAGAGVAFFRTMFPESYYPYNAGELVSVQTAGRKTVGYNLFDKEAATRDKFYYGKVEERNSPGLCHSDFIRVTPGVSYYTNATAIIYVWKWIFFDSDKQFIHRGEGSTFTAPAGAAYMAINFRLEEIDSLVVNISDPARNGQYEPYSAHTYPLDSTLTLRGVPVLTDGVPAYDGDKYAPDGTVTRRYHYAQLTGFSNWNYQTSAGYVALFKTITSMGLPASALTASTNSAVSGFVRATGKDNPFGTFALYSNGTLYFWANNTDAYPDKSAVVAAVEALAPTIVYELDTPTTETAAPYQEIQIAGSTEEFLPPETDTRAVAVPVGSVSLYQTNLRAGLEKVLGTLNGADPAHAESIAPVQGATASTNIAEGELLMQDGKLYTATQAIVAGAEIGSTNTTETTLAAQLAALEARIAALEN